MRWTRFEKIRRNCGPAYGRKIPRHHPLLEYSYEALLYGWYLFVFFFSFR